MNIEARYEYVHKGMVIVMRHLGSCGLSIREVEPHVFKALCIAYDDGMSLMNVCIRILKFWLNVKGVNDD